jgi:tetratricopeptide (TPR) repeat protein
MGGKGLNVIGLDKPGNTLKAIEEYAYKNLDILKPDESQAKDKEGFVYGGIMEGVQSLAPSALSMVPALLLGAVGVASPVALGAAGLAGAALYGLPAYFDAAEEYKKYYPDAPAEEIHNYALQHGVIEGSFEAASNMLSFGILKLGKISGLTKADTIKQILKTDEDIWTAEEHYIIGYLNEQDQRYAKAIPFYESAISLNSEFEAAYHNLGICLAETGEYEAALEQFEKALALDATYGMAQLGKGRILRRIGKSEEALSVLTQIHADEEIQAEVESELAACHEQLGATEQALKHIGLALELEPDDANYIAQRALLNLFSGEYSLALTDFLQLFLFDLFLLGFDFRHLLQELLDK